MSLKIGDTVTIVIGQPLPEGEPIDELIYTSMGYMPMSLLDYSISVDDQTGEQLKQLKLETGEVAVVISRIGTFTMLHEYRPTSDTEQVIKRTANIHTYDRLNVFPEQGNME